MNGERLPGGLSCGEVLARLSDYLDAELAPAARHAVEAHVQACTDCARFGGAVAAVVTAIRAAAPPVLDPGVAARLAAALRLPG